MGKSKISRREFVAAGAAVAGVGVAGSGCASKPHTQASAPPEIEQPQEQKGNGLNLIVVCVDTWGVNYLGGYGNSWIHTPNVDRFSRKCAILTDMYPETLPTIPTRRVLYTGRRIFPTQRIVQPDDPVRIRGWHQMFAEDITLAEILRKASYTTALVSDLYHQFNRTRIFIAASIAGAGRGGRSRTAGSQGRRARWSWRTTCTLRRKGRGRCNTW
ncbi:MAG TPA: sulfatase-like hydrolase/transferase [Bryobacterales bacterium]|nr:sulfatase-like hydrolase/transferase [Bryobacterales bacterium]